jgi:excisionase family DNA binding protein
MNTRISEAERQRCARQQEASIRQRAMSIDAFCCRYGIGRTSVYEEIKQGRLRAVKVGKRTLVPEDDAEAWLQRLPVLETGAVS